MCVEDLQPLQCTENVHHTMGPCISCHISVKEKIRTVIVNHDRMDSGSGQEFQPQFFTSSLCDLG